VWRISVTAPFRSVGAIRLAGGLLRQHARHPTGISLFSEFTRLYDDVIQMTVWLLWLLTCLIILHAEMNTRTLKLALLLSAALVAAVYSGRVSQAHRADTAVTEAYREMIQDYCVSCHSEKKKTAGIVLEGLDFNNVGAHTDTWEKVLRKVRTGQMPPVSAPKPEAEETSAFVNWLEKSLDQSAKLRPNPGRPAVHRLNRAEYSNAIRDLLAVDIKPGKWLPVDDSGYGFDNIGEVLTLSPALIEKYLIAARRVSRLAIGDRTFKVSEERYTPSRGGRNEKASDDLPFFSRGGLSFQHYFPLDAEYLIRIKTPSNGDTGQSAGFYEHRLQVKAGLRAVGAAFPRESAKNEPLPPAPRRFGGQPGAKAAPRTVPLDLRLDGQRIQRFEIPENTGIEVVILSGPYNAAGSGETASRSKIFICKPETSGEESPCAQKILSSLTRRAFRRPVTAADVTPLLTFYQAGRREGNFETGIQRALEALLVSPEFLLRIESDPANAKPGTVYRLNDLEIASRLSFFLWSSIPDDELLLLAEQGRLREPAVMQQQIVRLLDDPRSEAFIRNFGGQWLQLRNLETLTPDPDVFPNFDDSLRQSFRQETELFFESILRENRSILDLLEADYTFLNQRLAEHYGIRGVYGSQFRRVTLNETQRSRRGGLLGQGSVLTVTSYPNRTSVVQRGKWILENLLGSPPPPPPPDIPDLKPEGHDGRLLSMREQLNLHRANPICASCHARMDPIGFALENYDGIGKWRTKDAGIEIDASGKLPGGKIFSGPAQLRQVILTGHRDEFVATVIEKLMTYALGRGVESYDAPVIRSIMRETEKDNFRLSALIDAIVNSQPFVLRRTPAI
jgi:mono/diheme cytochrome c family protein